MNRLRLAVTCCAIPALMGLLFALGGCGGGNSSTFPPSNSSYSLAATALKPASITAGNSTSSTITVTPANGYTGSVTLSCGTISGSAAPACSFSPSRVSITGARAGMSTLTVSTTTSTPGGAYSINVTGKDANSAAPSTGPQSLALTMMAVIQHVVVIFQENRTPDNLFQGLCILPQGSPSACGTGQNQYDIAPSGPNTSGQTIALSAIDLGTAGSSPQNYDLSHANSAFVAMYDGGKMDGANLIPCSPAAGVVCPTNPQM